MRKQQTYTIDIKLSNLAINEVKRIDSKYDDKSIFKYGLTYVKHHDSFHKFLDNHSSQGHKVAFPEKEFQICLI